VINVHAGIMIYDPYIVKRCTTFGMTVVCRRVMSRPWLAVRAL
jgi:hypothetical protein